MGQPTPPGNTPLFDGLGAEWNDVLSGFPEDKRAEYAPKLMEHIKEYEPLKQWEDFQRSGVTPDQVGTALNVLSVIETNPQQVYETIGKFLNITSKQAEEVVKEVNSDENADDPRYRALQQQVNTLAQIALAQREAEQSSAAAAEQDKALDAEITALKKKHGDFPEDEIVMRMLHMDMTAEQAYAHYAERVSEIQKRRPAPFVMGSGGAVPREPVNVTKMDPKQTKDFVAQMLRHANQERQDS